MRIRITRGPVSASDAVLSNSCELAIHGPVPDGVWTRAKRKYILVVPVKGSDCTMLYRFETTDVGEVLSTIDGFESKSVLEGMHVYSYRLSVRKLVSILKKSLPEARVLPPGR